MKRKVFTWTAPAILVVSLLFAGIYTFPGEAEGRGRGLPGAGESLTVTEITNITETSEYYTVETTEIIIKGKGTTVYQVNFDMNDANLLFTESTDYDRTVVISSNTVDFEQLIIDANLVLNRPLDVNGLGTFNGGIVATDVNATDDMEIADDLILYGTARWGTDPNLGDVTTSQLLDLSASNNYAFELIGDTTFTVTDPSAFIQKGTFIWGEGAGGTHTPTWPANFNWPSDTEPTWDETAGNINTVSYIYWSTTDEYYCTGAPGFNP